MWKNISTYSDKKLKWLHVLNVALDWLLGTVGPIVMIVLNYFVIGKPDSFTKGLYIIFIFILVSVILKFIKKHFLPKKNSDYWNVIYDDKNPDGKLTPKISAYIMEMIYSLFSIVAVLSILYFFKTGFDVAFRTVAECLAFVAANKITYCLFGKFVENARRNDDEGKEAATKEIMLSNYKNKHTK